MMGPFEGAGGAVAGALPTSTAGMEEGGVPDADMLPRRASPCGWEREEARLPLLFFFLERERDKMKEGKRWFLSFSFDSARASSRSKFLSGRFALSLSRSISAPFCSLLLG